MSNGSRKLSFPVRLTPKGGRNAIEGWIEGPDGKRYLKARVSAPPEDGKANEALVRLIAKALDVGKTRVHIVSGGASRMKIIEAETESPFPDSWEKPS
jgi:uncharacterized protein (TIGR00251 family)